MATSARIISLNLGSQTIGLAEFQAQAQGGVVLQNYRLREVLIDPAGEGIRRTQTSATLREMRAELQIRHEAVNYAVSAQSVFARFVKLPAVEEEKIERIIAFEAQQNVPFPIDEVVWDYQLIGGGGEEQVQVMLVAIKSDLLDEMNAAVEETGLRTAIVDVATMALYNAFRYNYADLGGCSLLVDIGARTTNLLFIEPQRIFSRSIPVGGSSITVAIAKEFNEPFATAEFRKKRDGFVSLGGAYAEPADPEVARVSKLMRSTMTRLHAEVIRSISHYRAQQQGNAPERVFLCGGSASTPYMREFFREKLQVPIEFFNPLRNVTVAHSAPVNELTHSAHLLGELVGLALRSVGACPMELNLRPAIVVRRQELEKRRPFFAIAAAAVILALLGWGFYYTRAAQVARSGAEKIRNINAPMQAAEAKIEKLRKQATSLDALGAPLAAAINDRFFWTEILEDLNARLPKEDVWVTELIPLTGGKSIDVDEKHAAEITPATAASRSTAKGQPAAAIDGILLRGLYLFNPKQQEVVADYFRNLVGSPFLNVDPNNQARVIKSTIPNNTDWAFPYELRLELRKPVKLP
ncbi:MAG TPA: type IV pilus assembly protein PilM [Chthoniobacterales bacterium]|nr:type IV pilus assembly protein PilM [Chthoniobacterales bacterium]